VSAIPLARVEHAAPVRSVLKAQFASVCVMKNAARSLKKVFIIRPDNSRHDVFVKEEYDNVFAAGYGVPDRIGRSELGRQAMTGLPLAAPSLATNTHIGFPVTLNIFF